MSPFHVWVTEVQRVPALAELGLRSGTTSSPRSRPSLPSDGVPVLSLCPPDPRWPGAVWIGEPGTGDLGPGPQQPPAQGPPDAEQQGQDHLGLGRTQPLWVTPETTSVGDVVFKLSLRRKKKHGDNKERKWPGPAHPVSLVRPPSPSAWSPQGQPTTQASSRVPWENSGPGHWGCGRHGGRWPHQACPQGNQENRTSTEVGQQEAVGSVSGSLLSIHAGGQEVGGTRAYSASLTTGQWEPADGWRLRRTKELS